MLAGLWGAGAGTTSYSENIGVIAVTKVIICTNSQILGTISAELFRTAVIKINRYVRH